jgi:hypothetical protein
LESKLLLKTASLNNVNIVVAHSWGWELSYGKVSASFSITGRRENTECRLWIHYSMLLMLYDDFPSITFTYTWQMQWKCPVCLLKSSFFLKKLFSWKMNSWKVNYFSMFGNVMENKLKNIFRYLIMLWKINWKIIY